jgi:hypothetical protein
VALGLALPKGYTAARAVVIAIPGLLQGVTSFSFLPALFLAGALDLVGSALNDRPGSVFQPQVICHLGNVGPILKQTSCLAQYISTPSPSI